MVRCPALLLQILRCAQNDRDCHPERSRRRSEGSGASDWFSTLAATGDFKGDMHPDDATGSVYHGSPAHISRPPLGLCLCQSGRCLHRHWQMEKVEEQIPSWRIVVLCAETSTKPRLCARTIQYMLCMASSVRRGVSPATSLRTGSLSRDAVSDGLRNRFPWGRDPCQALCNSCVSIDCFSCKIMPFFNFSHRLLQVILFSMTTGLYTHIRIKSKAGRPSRAALPR